MASIGLLKIILQLLKKSPSFNLDDGFDLDEGFDLDDGFETASCRQTEPKIFRSFLEIKNKESIVYLEPRFRSHFLIYFVCSERYQMALIKEK